MRIAVLDPASFVLPYDYGLISALRSRGHDVTLYCSETAYNSCFADALFRQSNDDPGVIRYRISRSTGVSSPWAIVGYLRLLLALVRRYRKTDLVLLQYSIFLPLELLAALLFRNRVVYFVHNTHPHDKHRRWRVGTSWLAKLCHSLVFVSASERDRFHACYPERAGIPNEVLNHGLLQSLPSLQPGKRSTVSDKEPLPSFLGVVKPYKDIQFPIMALERGVLGQLDIFGRWDENLATLREQAVRAGACVENLFVDGARVHELLQQKRIFLLLYENATQSGVLYLLLNYRTPFIASDRGDLADFLQRHGFSSLVVRNRSMAALQAAIDYAIAHYDEIVAALEAIRPAYQWDSILAASPLLAGEPQPAGSISSHQ